MKNEKDSLLIEVNEVRLKEDYPFMYENFIVSSQQKLILLLQQSDNVFHTLQFDFLTYKYGYPNDEVSHPFTKYGLGFYGFFEVSNSPWVAEIIFNNSLHPNHSESLFSNIKHYIAKFKDVTLEVICSKYEERQLTKLELVALIDEQISYLKI